MSITVTATGAIIDDDANITPLTIDWGYQATDPFAVTLTMTPADGVSVTWTFARELVWAAMHTPGVSHGDGDVRILRVGIELAIDITDGALGSTIVTRAGTALTFLTRTLALVPFGKEYLDLDDELEQLLRESA